MGNLVNPIIFRLLKVHHDKVIYFNNNNYLNSYVLHKTLVLKRIIDYYFKHFKKDFGEGMDYLDLIDFRLVFNNKFSSFLFINLKIVNKVFREYYELERFSYYILYENKFKPPKTEDFYEKALSYRFNFFIEILPLLNVMAIFFKNLFRMFFFSNLNVYFFSFNENKFSYNDMMNYVLIELKKKRRLRPNLFFRKIRKRLEFLLSKKIVKAMKFQIVGRLNRRSRRIYKWFRTSHLPLSNSMANIDFYENILHLRNGSFVLKLWVMRYEH